MARQSTIWYWESRKSYYTTIGKKKLSLGKDKALAQQKFHQLMLDKSSLKSSNDTTLENVVDLFLEWVSKHRAEATLEWYATRLKEFLNKHKNIKVSELKPFHIQKWSDTKKSPTSRRNCIGAMKGCLKWAKSQGYIDVNPIADMSRPNSEPREESITPAEFADLLSYVSDQSFKQLLVCAYHTGARPQEILRVEAKHLDTKFSRWRFERKESKGKKSIRLVYLSDEPLKISKELAVENSSGPLFRNSDGNPWTKDAVGCAFDRLQIRMAKTRMREQGLDPSKLTRKQAKKFAKRYCLYVMRHSFATNALNKGVDCLSVSTLLGHKDPSTLAKTYQHLGHNPERLLEQAKAVLN